MSIAVGDLHSIDTSLWLFWAGGLTHVYNCWEQAVLCFLIRPVMTDATQYVRLTAETGLIAYLSEELMGKSNGLHQIHHVPHYPPRESMS